MDVSVHTPPTPPIPPIKIKSSILFQSGFESEQQVLNLPPKELHESSVISGPYLKIVA